MASSDSFNVLLELEKQYNQMILESLLDQPSNASSAAELCEEFRMQFQDLVVKMNEDLKKKLKREEKVKEAKPLFLDSFKETVIVEGKNSSLTLILI